MSIKSKLQACIITLDEADNIVRCLSSLSGLVDSVLVYDTGSNDETVNIARRHGARTVQGYWDDDFSAARNRALELCDSEWILSIDADEVLYCDVQNGVQDGVRQSLLVDEDVQSFEVTIRN
ncbi:MAG: glycosyltransferase, partial [Actinobacteria bacterium]|nr:glycosyltransferase [Actinomycetota bacterium]